MSPFTPFLAEYFYQNLRKIIPDNEREDSVHYLMYPTPLKEALNPRIEEAIRRMQDVIQLGRQARDRRNTPLKMPLNKFTIVHKDPQYHKDIEELKSYIQAEVNVKEVVITNDDSIVQLVAKPDFGVLGKRLRKDLGKVQAAIKALNDEQVRQLQTQGQITLEGHVITAEEMKIQKEYKGDSTKTEAAWDNEVLTILDLSVDEKMAREGQAREIINRIQKLRKKAGIHPSDPIEVFYGVDPKSPLAHVISDMKSFIKSVITVPFTESKHKPTSSLEIISESADILTNPLQLHICRLEFAFSDDLKKKFDDNSLLANIQTFFLTRDHHSWVKKFHDNGGKITFELNGKNVEVALGHDVFASVDEKVSKK